MSMRVVVFGSINMDLVAGVPHISAPGETVAGHSFATFPGGKGGNQALAAHLAFGGAGPLMATLLAEELDMRSIVVPPHAGNFSAWGLLGADLLRSTARTHILPLTRENLQRVTRETERLTRDAYLGVQSDISRVQALAQAVESSRTALEATQAGFDVGTRTIVDVLNSQFALYQSITNYYQARYDYILNVMRLKQAAGTLQVQDLEALEQFLVDRQTPEEEFAAEEEAE